MDYVITFLVGIVLGSELYRQKDNIKKAFDKRKDGSK